MVVQYITPTVYMHFFVRALFYINVWRDLMWKLELFAWYCGIRVRKNAADALSLSGFLSDFCRKQDLVTLVTKVSVLGKGFLKLIPHLPGEGC